MKPQSILINVIVAIGFIAVALALLDTGGPPPTSERVERTRDDSTQHVDMQSEGTHSDNTQDGGAQNNDAQNGGAKNDVQRADTSTRGPQMRRPPIADTVPTPGLSGTVFADASRGGRGAGAEPGGFRGMSPGASAGTGGRARSEGPAGNEAVQDARNRTSENLRETLGKPKRTGRDPMSEHQGYPQRECRPAGRQACPCARTHELLNAARVRRSLGAARRRGETAPPALPRLARFAEARLSAQAATMLSRRWSARLNCSAGPPSLGRCAR